MNLFLKSFILWNSSIIEDIIVFLIFLGSKDLPLIPEDIWCVYSFSSSGWESEFCTQKKLQWDESWKILSFLQKICWSINLFFTSSSRLDTPNLNSSIFLRGMILKVYLGIFMSLLCLLESDLIEKSLFALSGWAVWSIDGLLDYLNLLLYIYLVKIEPNVKYIRFK